VAAVNPAGVGEYSLAKNITFDREFETLQKFLHLIVLQTIDKENFTVYI
jgi:hypothetical protein